ncbi:beta-ureidopropionase [bacterium]|nr:beta-ureidopropionase [bacterium]
MSKKKIGFAQFEPKVGEVLVNLSAVRRLAAEAKGADLLVFPELATSGYELMDPDEVRVFAEPKQGGATHETLLDLAKANNCSYVIGYPEVEGDKFYNSSMLVNPDGSTYNYRKIHLFSREKELFNSGDAPPAVYETKAGRVGMMICFDWIFPETARMIALQGAQILAHPSNLVLQWCQRSMFARSVENRLFTITSNRIGSEERVGRRLTFTGASQVVTPVGETVSKAPETEEFIGLADIDPSDADNKDVTEYNHLFEDRMTGLYGSLV